MKTLSKIFWGAMRIFGTEKSQAEAIGHDSIDEIPRLYMILLNTYFPPQFMEWKTDFVLFWVDKHCSSQVTSKVRCVQGENKQQPASVTND
jgi:hypothetical protein